MTEADIARARLDLVMAWKRLFLDEAGQVRPDARTVFRDLGAFCGNGNPVLPLDGTGRIDPMQAVNLVSRMQVYSFIEGRLNTSVADLKRKIEAEHE